MIGHAGGWDEIVIAVGAVMLFLLFRSTRAKNTAEPGDGPCLYCGRSLSRDVERCPECGFRALALRRLPPPRSDDGIGLLGAP